MNQSVQDQPNPAPSEIAQQNNEHLPWPITALAILSAALHLMFLPMSAMIGAVNEALVMPVLAFVIFMIVISVNLALKRIWAYGFFIAYIAFAWGLIFPYGTIIAALIIFLLIYNKKYFLNGWPYQTVTKNIIYLILLALFAYASYGIYLAWWTN